MSASVNRPAEGAGRGRLPETIPIFPLTGVLLLPRGRLPLNIFEPRYLAMVEDALRRERIIGMVQPREPGAEAKEESPPVYATGCAGRIAAFRETSDGRFEIMLAGLSRFDIRNEERSPRGYRLAHVSYDRFAVDLGEEGAALSSRERLLMQLETFLRGRGLGADWGEAGVAGLPDALLVNWLAMSCPFAPSEKQALLESLRLAERASLLGALLEMASAEGTAGEIPHQ